MRAVLDDMRFGAKLLVKRPGLSFTAIVALALGIGLTTAMFSIVYGFLLRGLPYDEAENLVAISRTRPAQNRQFMPVTIHDFVDWREQQNSFESLAAYVVVTVNVSGTQGQPIRYTGARVSGSLFSMLGVHPLLGRTFTVKEDGPSGSQVMLLSHRAWLDRFDGDPQIIGQTVRANSELTTIVGVMPDRFDFPGQIDAWLPLGIDPLEFPRGSGPELGNTALLAIGRLADGVSLDQAQTEMSGIANRLATAFPASNEGIGVVLRRVMDSFVGDELPAFLYTMLGAVFGVLVIACANVTNLLLVRTVQRTKEVAIRTALGSSRAHTIGQVLSEAFVLSVIGAALGLGVAAIGVGYFNAALGSAQTPLWLTVALDPAAVIFVVGLTVVATLFAGIVPALRASRTDVNEILNDESRGSSGVRLGRASRWLVITEIAVSCGLLVAAGLMIRTVVNVTNFDYGFSTQNVFTGRVGLLEGDYPTAEDRQRFFDEIERRLAGQSGVRSVALTSHLPVSGGLMLPLSVEGVAYPSELDHPQVRRVVTTSRYFETLDVGPTRGRLFRQTDTAENAPVAIVNERFAELYLSSDDPVGRQIKLGGEEDPWRTVVGVVPDLNLGGVGGPGFEPQHEGVYVPLTQDDESYMTILMRTEQDPMTLTSVVQAEINAIDPLLPMYFVRSLRDQFALNALFYEIFGTLFTAFGVAALVLATIGLYGVMSFSTANRTREIGVRMALGAAPHSILRLILGRGVLQLSVGLGLGVGLAGLLSLGLRAVLFNVERWDIVVFTTVLVALSLAGVTACLIPARRAMQVHPVEALRYE